MKRVIGFLLVVLLCLCACGKEEKTDRAWAFDLAVAEESADGYVINWAPEQVGSNTGRLHIQNRNAFDIVVHLADNEEYTLEIGAGGVGSFYQIKADTQYQIGVHAEEPTGTPICIAVYEGEEMDPYILGGT